MLFGQTHLDCSSKALHNITSIRPCVVQSKNFISCLMNNGFGINFCLVAASILMIFVKNSFLERGVFDVIDLDLINTKTMVGVFLAHSTTAVFQRSEDCCWIVVNTDGLFICLKPSISDQLSNSSTQMPTHLGRCTCQFRQPFNNIS